MMPGPPVFVAHLAVLKFLHLLKSWEDFGNPNPIVGLRFMVLIVVAWGNQNPFIIRFLVCTPAFCACFLNSRLPTCHPSSAPITTLMGTQHILETPAPVQVSLKFFCDMTRDPFWYPQRYEVLYCSTKLQKIPRSQIDTPSPKNPQCEEPHLSVTLNPTP